MNYRHDKESPSQQVYPGFRMRGVDQLPVMAQEEVCPIIKNYFDYLENALTTHGGNANLHLLQEMLQEISLLLRSGKSQIRDDGYLRLLDRLTAIYTRGLRVENDQAYAGTAVNFADILESVSHDFQDYDYHPSVNLLLYYMDRLFNTREESWLEVHEYLLCMPDSIRFMQQLKTEHLNEISCWIEEGVDNLFTLWDEQLEVLAIQDRELSDLELQIMTHQASLASPPQSRFSDIVDFKEAQQRQMIHSLTRRRHRLMWERQAKREVVNLLEANVRDFSARLARMRRSTLLKLVWNNPLAEKR